MPKDGLRQEQKCLEAVQSLQERNWAFRRYNIFKAARTYGHPNPQIKELDGQKYDVIIVFRRPNSPRLLVLVLQVKSTDNSYGHFCRNPKWKDIKCILVREEHSLSDVKRNLDAIFKEVLSMNSKCNPYLRDNIPTDLL